MNNTSQNIIHISEPEVCPKCHNTNVKVVSTFDGEYFRHWVRTQCMKCNHTWTEIYQLDA